MHHKYLISHDRSKNILKIREFAVIDKIPKNVLTMVVQKENYSLIGQETYNSETVANSISKGKRALVATLRTKNLYPIEPYAYKIAESIITLFKSADEHSIELLFDDIDLLMMSEVV